ncbi:hypothetical protein Q2K19_11340 [Micromonospora soli]|uniref:hypothetical protein n=1 Tax=Micromonospora sp. NBRC 110009 TaxID=3061627 RepID=UPI002671A1DF|nr:hypothetical protein [Micromonospora sp. NBRC 110009]WKU01016.1 hypothetical protein Q2K19_11340 [Micromonospora sp. NBRC 110009]
MTAREFSAVDHDLLADYVGGALDGTPKQATVARLIDEDPAWAEAYAVLVQAVDLVHADLADWAAAAVPELPPTVADRITAALAGAGPAPTSGDAPLDVSEPAHDRDPAPATAAVVPAQPTPRRTGGAARPAGGPRPNTGPRRRSRRWARIAGPVALAAASIGVVGLGVSHLVGVGNGGTGVTAADGRAENGAAPRSATAPYRTTAPARQSGTDYTPEKLSGGSSFSAPTKAGGIEETPGGAPPENERLSAPIGLDRLTRPEALDSCLEAISAEHGPSKVTVDVIDYATFQGQPALVVTFVDPGGVRWAWVSGPECGVPGSGADTRFRTRVG